MTRHPATMQAIIDSYKTYTLNDRVEAEFSRAVRKRGGLAFALLPEVTEEIVLALGVGRRIMNSVNADNRRRAAARGICP